MLTAEYANRHFMGRTAVVTTIGQPAVTGKILCLAEHALGPALVIYRGVGTYPTLVPIGTVSEVTNTMGRKL